MMQQQESDAALFLLCLWFSGSLLAMFEVLVVLVRLLTGKE
jgi:hypothetical protein